MRHSEDRIYYQGRFHEEMERGERASNATIAAIHYELAYRYSILVAQDGPPACTITLAQSDTAKLAA